MNIKKFTFNPFQENTYIVWGNTKECIIVDPGCYSQDERKELINFIVDNDLKPRKLINTHCHIDHILGNRFISDHFNIDLYAHKDELRLLNMSKETARTYGLVDYQESPEPKYFINEGEIISCGEIIFKILFTPGHSPGHICLLNTKEKAIISGDVIFKGSIGRTDLPGGDLNILMRSIQDKMLNLDDETTIYSGHGTNTTIGNEKASNPFLR